MPLSNVSNGAGIIQAQGIGSGLNISSLVTQLVTAEGAPEQARLTRKTAQVATQLSALGALKGALAGFQSVLAPLKDVKSFAVNTANSADADIFSATANSTAVAGSYEIEVLQKAGADKLLSKAYAGGASATIGTGSLTISLGGTSFALAIDSTRNSLSGIRDAINNASNNPGVQASLVVGGDGAHLALTSTATGAAKVLRLSASGGDGGLAQLTYAGVATPNYTVTQAAADAIVKVSGVSVRSATDTVSGAIDGVSLTLKQADPGNTYTLTVASDQVAVVGNLQKFVDGYNALRTRLNSLSSYNPATQVAGPMLGDPVLNSVDSQVRRLLLAEVGGISGDYKSLASVGITSDASGKLVLNSDKLQTTLAAKPGLLAKLFGSTDGVAARLDAALTQMLGTGSNIAARDKSLASDQKALEAQRTRHVERLQTVQQRYQAQFNALDSTLAAMRRTSTYLAQQLGATSTSTSSSSTSSG
jgi:flagellar hook-associated protein 2